MTETSQNKILKKVCKEKINILNLQYISQKIKTYFEKRLIQAFFL